MSVPGLGLTQELAPSGLPVVRVGDPLLDAYLEFVAARCRPNTVLATAYDLKIFFAVVAKTPAQVRAADVLGFITAQRAGAPAASAVTAVRDEGGVSARTVRRRLSSVSGFYAWATARGASRPTRSPGGWRPAAKPIGRAPGRR